MNVGYIGGFIVLICLIISVIVALKKSNDKKALTDFLNGIANEIFKVMIETIKGIDPKTFRDFTEFNEVVITRTYDAVWDYVRFTADEAVEVNQITKAVFKLIDKATVVEFVQTIFDNKNVYSTIIEKYSNETKVEEVENKQDEESYQDQSQYIEDSSTFDLPPAEAKEIPASELSKINPPKEEEDEVVDLSDGTVEIIDQNSTDILTDENDIGD